MATDPEQPEQPTVSTPLAPFDKDWFPVRNDVVDYLMRTTTPSAFMVFMVIYRKTIGWHKSVDWISYSQIQKLTGLSRSAVWSALTFLTGEPNPRKSDPKQPDPNNPPTKKPKEPTYKLINAMTTGKLGDQKTYYSLNADLVIDIPKDEPEQPTPAYYQGNPEPVENQTDDPVAKSNQSVGVVAKCNQSGCKMQPTIDTIQNTGFDDDESNQISEILESKTAIKPINQQTINDLKALMIDQGRDVGGLTIDDLLAGIQDHATNPKAEAPTFATIGGLVRWAVTFKRNAKGKRKGGKGGHEFNKNNPPVYYQGDPDPEELNAYIEFVRERCIKAGYIMPNQAFPEDDTERNQLIDDFKSGHRIDEFKEYLQTIKQPQEAIPF